MLLMSDALNALFLVRSEQAGSENYSADLQINPSNDLFDIHFPGMPIVPGACLVGFVVDRFAAWRRQAFQVNRITRAMFGFPVVPSMFVNFSLRVSEGTSDQAASKLVYRYTANTGQASHGIIEFSLLQGPAS